MDIPKRSTSHYIRNIGKERAGEKERENVVNQWISMYNG